MIILFSLFIFKFQYNKSNITVDNNNLDKMADSTSNLFKEEEDMLTANDNIVESLTDSSEAVIEEYTGILTGYGPDCVGCGNFKTNKVSTASGYHIANIVNGAIEPAFTITYDDNEYGKVRIVAADSDIPFYSIVRITIPNDDPITAIVLDRGSTVGFDNCRSSKGWTSIILIMLAFFGITLFSIGIMGMYLMNILNQSKQMPHYLIRQKDVES